MILWLTRLTAQCMFLEDVAIGVAIQFEESRFLVPVPPIA
jgi:hypothetical protein